VKSYFEYNILPLIIFGNIKKYFKNYVKHDIIFKSTNKRGSK